MAPVQIVPAASLYGVVPNTLRPSSITPVSYAPHSALLNTHRRLTSAERRVYKGYWINAFETITVTVKASVTRSLSMSSVQASWSDLGMRTISYESNNM